MSTRGRWAFHAASTILLSVSASALGGQRKPPPPPIPVIKGGDVADKLRAVTGAQTRFVWVRESSKLVFFDTDDKKSEVERSFEGCSKLNRPIITPTGRQVVFIVFDNWASYIVNWDGSGFAKLVDGRVTCVRMDEAGAEWAYWQNQENEFRTAKLTDMSHSTVVWKIPTPPRVNKTENFQVSADGKCVGTGIPWPAVGIGNLPSPPAPDFVKIGEGCWPQMARDNSYRMFWCTDGSHRTVAMHDRRTSKTWRMPIGPVTDLGKGSAECPRWANDTRFIATTDRGGKITKVYLGRFNENWSAFAEWFIVTTVGQNMEADMWVAASARYPGEPVNLPPPVEPVAKPQPPPLPPTDVAATKSQPTVSPPAPTKPQPPPVPPKPVFPPWPPSHDGLAFYWENMRSDNRILDPDGKQRARCICVLRGEARPGRYGAADAKGGSILAESGARDFIQACRKSGQFTFEATLTPTQMRPAAPATILFLGTALGAANLMLTQSGEQLVLTLRVRAADGKVSEQFTPIGRLKPGQTQHLAVTHVAGAPGRTALFLDGAPSGVAGTLSGDLQGWQEHPLVFGDLWRGGRNWPGLIEGVALYSRALTTEQVKRDYEVYKTRLAGRTPAVTLSVTGKLLKTTPTPTLQSISPYPRCLVVYEYQVEKAGGIQGADALLERTIQVAHWAILDSRTMPLDRKEGQSYPLRLEKFSDWPSLEGERLISDFEENAEFLYLDVGR